MVERKRTCGRFEKEEDWRRGRKEQGKEEEKEEEGNEDEEPEEEEVNTWQYACCRGERNGMPELDDNNDGVSLITQRRPFFQVYKYYLLFFL